MLKMNELMGCGNSAFIVGICYLKNELENEDDHFSFGFPELGQVATLNTVPKRKHTKMIAFSSQ